MLIQAMICAVLVEILITLIHDTVTLTLALAVVVLVIDYFNREFSKWNKR